MRALFHTASKFESYDISDKVVAFDHVLDASPLLLEHHATFRLVLISSTLDMMLDDA